MFSNGTAGLYKQILDWKGVSMGLLPSSYYSYYSPYVFGHVIKKLFENYNLVQLFGERSYLTAARIVDFLTTQIDLATRGHYRSDYTKFISLSAWRSFKYFARFSDCAPIINDGAECHKGQGLCSINRISHLMNISEYCIGCPRQIPLLYGDCPEYPNNVVCCAKPYPPLQFGAHLVKSEFRDVVVAIHQGIYKNPSIISDLVITLTKASKSLYRASRGRAYFRTVTILNQWNDTHGNATYETFRDADFKVVPEYDEEPHALTLGSCYEPGLGVYLAQNHLRYHGASEKLAKLFAMNRWGIGDEFPSSIQEIVSVPNLQSQGVSNVQQGSSCSVNMIVDYSPQFSSSTLFNLTRLKMSNRPSAASFAFRPDVYPEENAEFCATTTIPHCDDTRRHNPEPNTPHNRMCNRTSTLGVIRQALDFDQTQNSPRFVGDTDPVFRFVKYPPITSHVLAIVADFSGSVTPTATYWMINALIDFLHVVPDEVPVVLVSVGPIVGDNKIHRKPFSPLGPFLEPTGGIHFGRQELIEQVKDWMYFIRPVIGPANTSVLTGVEELVQAYLPLKHYRLRILVMSDFLGVAPSDNGFMYRLQEAGYSIWPIALWSRDKITEGKKFTSNSPNLVQAFANYSPLYFYAQALANQTYGRWQYIQNYENMTQWFYALSTFLDDNNYGTAILIDHRQVNISGSVSFDFQVPQGYSLNTSIVVDFEHSLWPVEINGSQPYFKTNCSSDDRGQQGRFTASCLLGDLTSEKPGSLTLNLTFGNLTAVYVNEPPTGRKTVSVMIVSRAILYGSAYRGDYSLPSRWIDPWVNRIARLPTSYFQGEARLSKGLNIVMEKSAKFRFPKVYAIISNGYNALLNCPVVYDLYLAYVPDEGTVKDESETLITSGKMYDDGLGEDGNANDGVYTALILPKKNGTYTVHVRLPQNSTCVLKAGVALVGKANDNTTVIAATGTNVSFSFYKVAGSFDVLIPPGSMFN